MIKESKYILRRILIGVGIILVLGFIRSNKAHALETVNVSWLNDTPARVASDSTYQILSSATDSNGNNASVYRNRDTGYYAICFTGKNTCEVFNPSQYFTFTNVGIMNAINGSSNIVGLFFTNNGNLPTMNSGSTFRANFQVQTFEIKLREYINNISTNSTILQPGENGQTFSGYRTYYSYKSNVSWTPYSGNNATVIEFLPPSESKILSIEDDIEQDGGYVYRVYLIPHYSNFNPDLYSYEFKIGKDGVWEDGLLDGAGIPFTINGNVYFRVVDKSNNNVVDSATYTISEISKVYQGSSSSVDYNIDINATYNTLSVSNNINKVFLNVSFTPAYSSFIKYYYKFGSGDWVEIEEEEFNVNSWTYITNVNGTFYVKMEDLSGNILFDKTYVVNEIGKLGLMVNDSNMNNYFTSLSSKIGFGGPISSLINVPIRVLSVIGDSFSSGATCTNYSLGSLWGTNLVLPCVNVKQHLGNTLYTTIDLILSGVMIYTIFMWLCSMYDKFMNLDRDPAGDISRLGRW